MSYAQLDTHFDEHVKFEGLSLGHLGLMACAFAYCNRALSDGVIPRRKIRAWGREGEAETLVNDLVKRGIWKWTRDGYLIVGYLDHNPSRAEVLSKLAAKKARQKKFYEARVKAKGESPPQSSVGNDDISTRREGVTQDAFGVSRNRVNAVVGDVDAAEAASTSLPSISLQEILGGQSARAAPTPTMPRVRKARPQKPRVAPPPSTATDEEVKAFAARNRLDVCAAEFPQFLDYHRHKGTLSADWPACWRTWLRKGAEFARERRSESRLRAVPASSSVTYPYLPLTVEAIK